MILQLQFRLVRELPFKSLRQNKMTIGDSADVIDSTDFVNVFVRSCHGCCFHGQFRQCRCPFRCRCCCQVCTWTLSSMLSLSWCQHSPLLSPPPSFSQFLLILGISRMYHKKGKTTTKTMMPTIQNAKTIKPTKQASATSQNSVAPYHPKGYLETSFWQAECFVQQTCQSCKQSIWILLAGMWCGVGKRLLRQLSAAVRAAMWIDSTLGCLSVAAAVVVVAAT